VGGAFGDIMIYDAKGKERLGSFDEGGWKAEFKEGMRMLHL
jgi:hypothetical protein